MKKVFFYLFTFLFFFILLDILVGFLKFDLKLIQPTLYHVEGEFTYIDLASNKKVELIEESSNPELLFKLRDNINVECKNCLHPEEKEDIKVIFNTDQYGGRKLSKSNSLNPQKIFWIGGSFSAGATIDQKHTLPNLMQEYFNKNNHPFQIYNFSANAYNMSQKTEMAKIQIKKIGLPKKIIFQNSNFMRRAFFYKTINEYRFYDHFRNNDNLYYENYADVFLPYDIHKFFVSKSAIYRTFVAIFQFYKITNINLSHDQNEVNTTELWNKFFTFYFANEGNNIGRIDADNFIQQYKDKIDFYEFVPLWSCQGTYEIVQENGYKSIRLCLQKSKGEHYTQIHPPAYVYRWYGEIFQDIFEKHIFSN